MAAITGSVAEDFYGIDEEIKETALSYLDDKLLDTAEKWLLFVRKAKT